MRIFISHNVPAVLSPRQYPGRSANNTNHINGGPDGTKMTFVSILEQKMDELARKYVEHDKKIIDELCELARELMEMEKLEKQ